MARKEWERTCKRDGTVWFVSLDAAKERKPNALYRAGVRTQAAGSGASLGFFSKAGGATQLHQLEAKLDRIERNNRCPNCGSGSFTQRKVKI